MSTDPILQPTAAEQEFVRRMKAKYAAEDAAAKSSRARYRADEGDPWGRPAMTTEPLC